MQSISGSKGSQPKKFVIFEAYPKGRSGGEIANGSAQPKPEAFPVSRISRVVPHPWLPNATDICFKGDESVLVKGSLEDVVAKLNA